MLNQATFYNVEHQKSDLRADGYLLEPKSGGLVPLVMIVKSCAEIGRLPDIEYVVIRGQERIDGNHCFKSGVFRVNAEWISLPVVVLINKGI